MFRDEAGFHTGVPVRFGLLRQRAVFSPSTIGSDQAYLERLGRKQQRENVDRDEKQSLVEDGLREACFFSLSCGCALH